MAWNKIFISVVAGCVIFVLNIIGSKKGLYGQRGENRWFGKIMHFSGIYKLKKSKTNKYLIHIKDTIEDLIFDITGAGVFVVFLKLFL